MATITTKNAHNLPSPGFGGVPYGNRSSLFYQMKTNASGVIANSNVTDAVGNGDVVVLGVLPAGMKLCDMVATISDAFTASSTGKIGFKYVDGVDVTAVPQDDDFFCAATSLASLAVIRKTATTAPLTLPKDAYLILTNAGAAQAAAGQIDIEIIGQINGN
jgi:hypothetical protein